MPYAESDMQTLIELLNDSFRERGISNIHSLIFTRSKGGDLSENLGVRVFSPPFLLLFLPPSLSLPLYPVPSPPHRFPLPFMASDSEPKIFLGSPDACR
jgi:hypothetical protein